MVAVSTPDLRVVMWALRSNGPCFERQAEYSIPSAQHLKAYAPAPPIAFTGDDVLAIADPVGRIYFVAADGTELGSIMCGKPR